MSSFAERRKKAVIKEPVQNEPAKTEPKNKTGLFVIKKSASPGAKKVSFNPNFSKEIGPALGKTAENIGKAALNIGGRAGAALDAGAANLGVGLANAAKTADEWLTNTFGYGAINGKTVFGDPNYVKNHGGGLLFGDSLNGFINTNEQRAQESDRHATEGASAFGKLFYQGIEAIPQMTSGTAAFTISSMGQYAKQAKDAGASLDQQALMGLLGGGVEAVSEKLFGLLGDSPLTKKLLNIIPGFKKISENYIGKLAVGTVGEGLQEGLTDPFTNALEKVIYNPDRTIFDIGQMSQDAAGGAMLGLLFRALGMPTGSKANKKAQTILNSDKSMTVEQAQDIQNTIAQEQSTQPVSDTQMNTNPIGQAEASTATPEALQTNSFAQRRAIAGNAAKNEAPQKANQETQAGIPEYVLYGNGLKKKYGALNKATETELNYLTDLFTQWENQQEAPTTLPTEEMNINPTTQAEVPTGQIAAKEVAAAVEPSSQTSSFAQRRAAAGQTDGTKPRKFIANSTMNSELIPEQMKTDIQSQPEKYQYKPISTQEQLSKAEVFVDANPQRAMNDLMSKDTSNNIDLDVAKGEALIKKYIQEGDNQSATDATLKLAELLTRYGREVQAASIMKRLTPEGMLYYAEKQIQKARESDPNLKQIEKQAQDIVDGTKSEVEEAAKTKDEKVLQSLLKKKGVKATKDDLAKIIEWVNAGAFTNEKYKALVEGKLGIAALSAEDTQFIVDTMKNVQTMGNGRAKEIEIGKVMQRIADKIPAGAGEKFRSIRRMAMLLNPKTLLTRNPGGNVVFGMLENIKQPISGLADMATKKYVEKKGFEGQRKTTVLPQMKAQAQGMVQGIKELAQDSKLGIDTSTSRGKYEIPHSKRIFRSKILNAANNMLSTLLQAGDRPFYQSAYNEYIAEQQKLGNEINDKVKQEAIEYGLERVFQNKGTATELARKAKGALNVVNVKGFGIGDIVMPFTQTPANILSKGVEYTPIGILKVIKEAPTNKKLLNGEFNQRKFTDAIGRTMTGSALATLGYLLAKNGLATGEGEKDDKAKAYMKALGISNYSIKFGNKYYTFDWAQPASIPLAIGIDFYNAGKGEKDLTLAMQRGVTSGFNSLIQQSFLQGVNQLLGGYDKAGNIIETLIETPLSLIPTASGQVAQQIDPYKRQVEYGGLSGLKQAAMKKIPGLSQQLQPQVDVWGNEVKAYQGRTGAGEAVENFLAPGYVNEVKLTPLDEELLRLYNSTGNSDMLPRLAPDKFTWDGDDIVLTPQEKHDMQVYMGEMTRDYFEQVFNDETYKDKDLTDKDKAKAFADVAGDIYDVSREYIVNKRSEKTVGTEKDPLNTLVDNLSD